MAGWMSKSNAHIMDDMASHIDVSAAIARRASSVHGAAPPLLTRSVVSSSRTDRSAPLKEERRSSAQLKRYHVVTGPSPLCVSFQGDRSVSSIRIESFVVHETLHVSEGANQIQLELCWQDSDDGRATGAQRNRAKRTVYLPVGNYTLDTLASTLEATLNEALEALVAPRYSTKTVLEQLCSCYGNEAFAGLRDSPRPFEFRVTTTSKLKKLAERKGEADVAPEDFVGARWTPRYEGDWDMIATEPLLLARLLYATNNWAWRELADERDQSNRWRWPFHTRLHKLMSPRDTVLPERLFVTLHHVLHSHPRAGHIIPQAKAHWKPFLTVPSFSLEIPNALQAVLGMSGLHKSTPATAELPPLSRFYDGRDQMRTVPGNTTLPCEGDDVECVMGQYTPLRTRGSLFVVVRIRDEHVGGRVLAQGVHGAGCAVVGEKTLVSSTLDIEADHLESLEFVVLDECGSEVNGLYSLAVSVE